MVTSGLVNNIVYHLNTALNESHDVLGGLAQERIHTVIHETGRDMGSLIRFDRDLLFANGLAIMVGHY